MILSSSNFCFAQLAHYSDLHEDQAKEKIEVQKMNSELKKLKPLTDKMTNELNSAGQTLDENSQNVIHLIVKDDTLELAPKFNCKAVSYNHSIPGPIIKLNEGANLKIIIHNQSASSTSFYIQGLKANNSQSGLATKMSDLILPNSSKTFEYNNIPKGLYYYRPQATHLNQMSLGLYGALIVDSKQIEYEKDYTLVLSKFTDGIKTAYLVNGKQAPEIPSINLSYNQRIRLHLINITNDIIPLTLTGHKFEIISQDGSDELEPHIFRDIISLKPYSRVDCDFTADNPGIWSLSSLDFKQSSYLDKFPGGLAVVVHYDSFN